MRAREVLDRNSPREPAASTQFGGSRQPSGEAAEELPEDVEGGNTAAVGGGNDGEDGNAEQLGDEEPEGAAAALQLLGTGFSPAVPRQLAGPYSDPSSSLLPIPPSLRAGSAEPEDPRQQQLLHQQLQQFLQQQRRLREQGQAEPGQRRDGPSQQRGQKEQGRQTVAHRGGDEASHDTGWCCCGVCGIRLDLRPPWPNCFNHYNHQHPTKPSPRRTGLHRLARALVAGLCTNW